MSSAEDLTLITDKFRDLGQTNAEYLPLITALTVLAETGDTETITEVINLIIDLRDQIKTANE
jgi:hypothetical protein